MRATGRLRALALATVVMGLSAAAPAQAADEITIDHVESDRGAVSLLLSTDGLPAGAPVENADISVELNGAAVEATSKLVDAGDVDRSTVLVLDVSNSMQHKNKFEAATQALNAFLDTAPDDVAIGLVAFAGEIEKSIAPSLDHQAVRDALASVTLKKGTSVYDGIAEGVKLLGDEGSRSLLVLSDGGDTGSAVTLEVSTTMASEAGVAVDVVSLTTESAVTDLASISEATEGSVIPADPTALTSVFNERADALAKQLLVTFDAPTGTSADVSIDVIVEADGQTYHDSAFANLGAGFETPDVIDTGRALVGKPAMLAGAAALAVGLAGLLAIVLNGAGSTRSESDRRLDAYFGRTTKNPTDKASRKATSTTSLKGSAVEFTSKVVSDSVEARVAQRLAGAGSSLNPSEWVLFHACMAVFAGLLGLVMGGVVLSVAGLILGVVGPWIYLKFKHGRRLSAFNAQLAQTLGLMAGGLQAGLSLPQAVDTVVREGHEPMAGELRRALVEQRLGVDITDSLDSVGERMESADFAWVVMAIRIQREVGGNLAEILHTVADTLREREYLRRQVKALSAEGRLSGYILTALPILIFFYMMMANPDYVELLYTTVPGYVMLAMAGFLLGLGSFAMSKLAKVEV